MRGDGVIRIEDFTAAFLTVAALGAVSTVIFASLPADAGAELAGRPIAAATPPDATPGPMPGE
jgi:hypothetical protein